MEDVIKILIADDNEHIAVSTKNYIIEDKRFEIVGICCDEELAIQMIEELKPDLVITDIKKKSGFNGLDIVSYFKNKDNSPIFFIVSGGIAMHIENMHKLGIKYYLQKPYLKESLLNILNNIYNEIYPKQIILKSENLITTDISHIRLFFNILKKRIGI